MLRLIILPVLQWRFTKDQIGLTPLRIVKENTPGWSIARQKGFDTAKYEYIVFCDDDNLLKDDFVKQLLMN
ncbi:MAG: glycosyltransferase family A protein [Ignavibacteria bacterium]